MKNRHAALHAVRVSILALLASAAIFCSNASARVIDDPDEWSEPIYLKQKDIGTIGVANEDVWYKITLRDNRIGFSNTNFKNNGRYLEIKSTRQIRIPSAHIRLDLNHNIQCEAQTLRPLKETLKGYSRSTKGSLSIDKTAYYDWNKRQITIVYGKGERSRSIKMQGDFIYNSLIELIILDKRFLVQNSVYQFSVFQIETERFEQLSFKVFQPDLNKNEFVVTYTSPNAVGDYNNLKLLVTPKSDKYPNGAIIRYWFDTYTTRLEINEAVRTTKEKATKKQ